MRPAYDRAVSGAGAGDSRHHGAVVPPVAAIAGMRIDRRFACLCLLAAFAVLDPAGVSAQPRCSDAGRDRIACENRLPGAPPEEWDVKGAGDPSIQGFTTSISAAPGEQVEFKVATDAAAYRLDIYRLGYYGGRGARLIATLRPSLPLPHTQPHCLLEVATGLIDCGNWRTSASWVVPDDAVSGLYVARLVRDDTGGASHVPFIVRGPQSSDILVQLADSTWAAYNDFGGNSLYTGYPRNRAFKVSYNRPFANRGNQYSRSYFWATAYPMIRWLEANGYDVNYTSTLDTARDGASLLRHKVFVSLGHDEYWTVPERENVKAARDAGVHIAFFSGNTMFWRGRWEPSIDGTNTPDRTLVVYKDTHEGVKTDPASVATGTWRDPRFGPADPENALIGTLFVVNCCRFDDIVVSAEEGRRRFWRNTAAARQDDGASVTLGKGIVGFEWDTDVDNGLRPDGLFRLSSSTVEGAQVLVDYGSSFSNLVGPVTHHMTMYRHESGALVFSAGTANWGWALDAVHDDPDHIAAPVDRSIQQATVNLFADMGVHGSSLQEGLVDSDASTDTTPPVVVIESPGNGAESTMYREVVVTGTVSDEGGVASGVEVSIDNGIRWYPAEGVSPWTFRFRPTERETVIVLARAVDDSGNLQRIPTWISVNVVGFGLRRLATWGAIAAAPFVLIAAWWLWRRRSRRAAAANPLQS